MNILDENGNLVEIPENIQKHIEAREKFWVDKIKDIDSKCGIVLERLALTEKALEKLRWKPKEVADYIQDITYCYANVDNKMLHINRDKFDEIIKQAKEIMKSE